MGEEGRNVVVVVLVPPIDRDEVAHREEPTGSSRPAGSLGRASALGQPLGRPRRCDRVRTQEPGTDESCASVWGREEAIPAPSARPRGRTMPAIIVIGTQWGDEGKGKATDQLGDRVDYVVRYSGGHNAGHTVVVGLSLIHI